MNYRKSEIEKLKLDVRWLDQEHSQHAYDFATKYSADDRYGLNGDTVSSIKRHEIESGSVAKNWLSNQLSPDGTVQVVFSESEVFVIKSEYFLNSWQEIFMPARDDAMVIHNNSSAVVFYCHEDELEVGQRNA